MNSPRDPLDLISRARDGDRRSLARLISLVEDEGPGYEEALASLFASAGEAWTSGITGAPGAGKSTLVDRLIGELRAGGPEVAVVAVDPSSPFSGGAILGDLEPTGLLPSFTDEVKLAGLKIPKEMVNAARKRKVDRDKARSDSSEAGK